MADNQDVVAVNSLRKALQGNATPQELETFWTDLCGSLHPTNEWPVLRRIIEASWCWNHTWDTNRGKWVLNGETIDDVIAKAIDTFEAELYAREPKA